MNQILFQQHNLLRPAYRKYKIDEMLKFEISLHKSLKQNISFLLSLMNNIQIEL